MSRPLLRLNVQIVTGPFGETACKLFLLTFTAEVPVKYSLDPSHIDLSYKFYRVTRGVLYLPQAPYNSLERNAFLTPLIP